ncbi:type II toxin-antitoxin system RelE/ParE family toxin [Candidatus Sumerlaeota bacterium]|nr:type II toxin-antitoxin system RelE/ParE family toxin [Candidatus Sumerlaeota bacterium]
MEVRFLETAQIELDEVVEYYNSESSGLGDEFLLEALDAIERIRHFPKAWHPFTENTRKCRLRRFPYGVIYQTSNREILIVAIAHLHREPGYWKERIGM